MTWQWIEGTDNAAPLGSVVWGYEDPDLAIPEIGDEHYLNLGMSYRFGEHLEARFGVNNLFDNDPPQTADVYSNNTDPSMYDVFGRSYYLTLSAHF